MKKFISVLLCFNLLSLPAISQVTINDNFADTTLDKTLTVKKRVSQPIIDTFVEQTLDKNLKIKTHEYIPIEEPKIEACHKKKEKIILQIDEVLPQTDRTIQTKKVKSLALMESDKMTPVYVKIKHPFTTKSKTDEGEYVEFELIKDVQIKDKLYPKGYTVKARVETISRNESMGVPSDLIVGSFKIDEIPLYGEINKTGANRSLWVSPLVYGTCWFFGVGLLFIPVRGGHAKLNPKETFTLYAE